MRHLCPECRRSFEEPGFCPFDRARLVATTPATAEQPTLVVEPLAAVPVESERARTIHKTDLEPKRTFPLSPTPPASAEPKRAFAHTELTGVRTHPGAAAPPTPLRALSASDSPLAALASYRGGKPETEYDRLVGQTLDGRYFVEKKIGEGGMGVVFAARHAVIERPLAIKVLKREVMRDDATIRRFVQEAKAASRIGHPNIVDVTDFGTTPDGMTYSVMEFVHGHTLGAALRASAPFGATRTIKIASQIARALGAAHDKGIVHRDLKPENVFLVDRDGRTDFVKIVDFGIAKVTPVTGADPNQPRLTRAGSVFGTPEYMAPEQAAGRGDTDGRVDVYALGVIVYEMITGRVPHRGDSMVRTLAMQMLDPIEPPTKIRPDLEISPELDGFVMRALAKKREHRFQTMHELLAAIERVQTPVGVSLTGNPIYALAAVPPGADPQPWRTQDDSAPILVRTPNTANTASRRLKDEPEFVTPRDKPATFEHVFTDEFQVGRQRRWPVLVLGTLIASGAGAVIAVTVKSCRATTSVASRDAGVEPPIPADATRIAIVEPDAAVDLPMPIDAVDFVFVEDAGVRSPTRPLLRDAGVAIPSTPNGRGTISIQVITKPEGANLYAGHSYRGPGGTNLEERLGSKLDIECRLRGYKSGHIALVFDGRTEYALCILQRIKICIDNIKNPFDDCELDPNAPSPIPMP